MTPWIGNVLIGGLHCILLRKQQVSADPSDRDSNPCRQSLNAAICNIKLKYIGHADGKAAERAEEWTVSLMEAGVTPHPCVSIW